jgi:hypothetical protein
MDNIFPNVSDEPAGRKLAEKELTTESQRTQRRKKKKNQSGRQAEATQVLVRAASAYLLFFSVFSVTLW